MIPQTLLLALLAVIPLGLYLWLMWRMDRYEREPLWLLLLVFAWGAGGAVFTSMALSQAFLGGAPAEPGSSLNVWRVAVAAPVFEEPAKALIFLWLFRHREFDNVTDGFVYGAAAGLGFAMTENYLYFTHIAHTGNAEVLAGTVAVRTLFSALLHAGATSLVGAAFGLAKFRRRRQARILPWIGLGCAMLMHATWNGLLVLDKVTQGNGALTLLDFALFPLEFFLLFALFQRSIRYEERLLARELAGEVPDDQLPLLCNYRKHRLVTVPEGFTRKEYLQACTRLAFRKEQAGLIDDPRYHAAVAYWRGRLQRVPHPPGF